VDLKEPSVHRVPSIDHSVKRNDRNSGPAASFMVCLLVLGALPALAADVPGIGNFGQVDAHVYRGAQPTPEGFRYLVGIGVKTVIDLRESGARSREEERTVTESGMKYLNVPMSGLTAPTEAEILKLLPLLEDASSGAVFVHCWRGADRTGSVIAAYHIDHDHWDSARALEDADTFKMSRLQIPRRNFIRNFRPLADEPKTAAAAQ
jgi:protein-tyrosine phosphatase